MPRWGIGRGATEYQQSRKKDKGLTSRSFDDDDSWASLGSSNSGSQQNLGGDITTFAENENDPHRGSPRSALEQQDIDESKESLKRGSILAPLTGFAAKVKGRVTKTQTRAGHHQLEHNHERDAEGAEGTAVFSEMMARRPEARDRGMLGNAYNTGISAVARGTAGVNAASTAGIELGIDAAAASRFGNDFNFKSDHHLPRSVGRWAQEKSGQGLKVLGHALQTGIPILGGLAASPFSFLGEYLEGRGQGMSRGEAASRGAGKAGAGIGIGAIPIYGQAQGFSAFSNDVAQFVKPSQDVTVEAALTYLRELRDDLDDFIEEQREDTGIDPRENIPNFAQAYDAVVHYIDKYTELRSQPQATSWSLREMGNPQYAPLDDDYD